MDLGGLFQQVAGLVEGHTRNDNSVDTDGFLGQLGNLFGQHSDTPIQQGGYEQPNILPASQDPMGDPADQGGYQGGGNILPASQDPLGDPADQQ